MVVLNKKPQHWWLISAAIALILFSWLPQLLTLNPGASYGDEGVVASAAWRIFNGEIPYRDFYSALTPGSYYWSAAFFTLLGPSFLVLRISVLVTALIILLGSVWILERIKIVGISPYLLVVSFLAFFGGPYWFIASHHWLSLAWCLVSFAFFLCAANASNLRWAMFAAGCFAALAACTMQNKGVLWMALASVGLFSLPREQRKQAFLCFWFGVLLISLPVVLWFVNKAGFYVLFEQMVEFPLTRYNKLEAHQGVVIKELLKNGVNVFSAWGGQSSWFDWLQVLSWNLGYLGRIVVHLLPLGGLVALAYLWKTKARDSFVRVGLTAFYLSMYIAAAYRPSETTLVFAAPAALFVLALAVDNLRRGGRKAGRALTVAFLWGWLILFGGTAAGFSSMEIFAPKISTTTKVGTIQSSYPQEAQDLAGVTRFMAENLRSGESVFCYNYVPMFYFLLQAKNPTPYDILIYPMNTQEQLERAQLLLEKIQCRWIVYDFAPLFSDSFGTFVLQNYELVKRFNNVAILKRRTLPDNT